MAITRDANPDSRPPLSRALPPVTWWAAAGVLMTLFMAYMYASWLIGPSFSEVASGPDSPPQWMQTALVVGQILLAAGTVWCFYRFVWRPWRRQGRVGLDGFLVVGFTLLVFQDTMSNYFGYFFVVNAWMANRGTWAHQIPGWQSWGEPGRQVPESLVFLPTVYLLAFFIASRLGARFMGRLRRRRPQIVRTALIAACLPVMAVLDLLIEGVIMVPLGFYTYPGATGWLSINADTYYKFPLSNMLFMGLAMTGFASLRYFVDDGGQSIVERGAHRSPIGAGQHSWQRLFAVIAVIQLCYLIFFTVPGAILGHYGDWPADLQNRSYFTDQLCGPRFDRTCPP